MLDDDLRTHYSRIAVAPEAERRVRDLLFAEISNGRRRAHRRASLAASTAAVIAAGVAVAALAAHGGQRSAQPGGSSAPVTQLTTAASPDPPTRTSGLAQDTLGQMSWRQAASTLANLLPGHRWTVLSQQGRIVTNQTLVELVINDGRGAAQIDLALTYPIDPAVIDEPGAPGYGQAVGCKEDTTSTYENGACTVRADGTEVLTSKGHEYPADPSRGNKLWLVHAVRANGLEVDISEWNAPTEKGSPASRANPPLSIDELTAMTLSDSWETP